MSKTTNLAWLFFLVISLNTVVPSVRAQTVMITNVNAPRSAFTGRDVVVSVDVSWDGGDGHYLGVGIWNQTANVFLAGNASSSGNTCESNSGQYSGTAACLYALKSSSGSAVITFHLKFDIPNFYLATILAVVEDSNSFSIPCPFQTAYSCSVTYVGSPPWDWRGLSIVISNTLSLDIFVQSLQGSPISINATVDGVQQTTLPRGPVHIRVTPGSHTVSLPTLILVGDSMRFRFEKWSDGLTDPTRILDLEADTALTANYVTQYQLTLTSAQGYVTGSGWYDLGSVATFSALPSSLLWTFQAWYEGDRQVTSSINGSITMKAPHSLTARWSIDYTILGSIVGVAVIATVGLAYYGKKRKRDSPATKKRGFESHS